jgi:hypothetical protein
MSMKILWIEFHGYYLYSKSKELVGLLKKMRYMTCGIVRHDF